MLIRLTSTANDNASSAATDTAVVGGKASSLAKLYRIPALHDYVPKSYALSTTFFEPWMDIITRSSDYDLISNNSKDDNELKRICDKLKETCVTIPMDTLQQQTLSELSHIITNEFNHRLAAVRSSATEEDGKNNSFAGVFETKLGVSSSKLEEAVRYCFASKFDYRVFRYMMANNVATTSTAATSNGFAVVVMEMVDAEVAGVSFSASPLNSDRDEVVVDSSFGLGESVVDGSVTADRFIYDKVQNKLVEKIIGSKKVERRLNLVEGGGVTTIPIDDMRQASCSLSEGHLNELVRLTCIVEKEYGVPMDVEWAVTDNDSRLLLLQARPITTLFWMDDSMMTEPGEKRVLYYDFNIASEATTTTPFKHMDLSVYCQLMNILGGMPRDANLITENPKMPMFNASTRQYCNLSIFLKYLSPQYLSKEAMLLDPYLASLFASKDCNRKRYRLNKLPKGVNLKNFVRLCRQFPVMEYYRISKQFKKNPEKAKENYIKIVQQDMAKLDELERRGYVRDEGLGTFADELLQCILPSINQEMGLIYFILLGTFKELDKQRRNGKTEQIRSQYDALSGGYEGDEIMEVNIAMYRLAHTLDSSIWQQYEHEQLDQLADRIQQNNDGVLSDLPPEFISEWNKFISEHGWDGEDQLFISSPRYQDKPVLLLARLRNQNSASFDTTDPFIIQQEQVKKRQNAMKVREERALSKKYVHPFALSKVRKQNFYLDHLMWIRNAPKMHISKVIGVLRASILKVEADLINANRLEVKDDIFHLDLAEVDRALMDDSYDLMSVIRPRKAIYERAMLVAECPLLIDSRCRILRADPPAMEDVEEGVLIGVAISPGTATGRVRVMKSPTDKFERGEVLAATVTSPAWTPLFVGASAVILHIGGALQHGALCAREFKKPAVSNIDIHNVLKTGMLVTVDGNMGTVKII